MDAQSRAPGSFIEGQCHVELIDLRILHSDDVGLFKQVLNRLFVLDKLHKLDRSVVIVLGIKIALDNDIPLEFSNFCCQI